VADKGSNVHPESSSGNFGQVLAESRPMESARTPVFSRNKRELAYDRGCTCDWQWSKGQAAVADHSGRTSLLQEILSMAKPKDSVVAMAMEVNESWRHNAPVDVNDAICAGADAIGDQGNHSIGHCNIAPEPRFAGPIYDLPTTK